MIIILLAAFNEQDNLPNLFDSFIRVLSDYTYRIVLVNDGSTDETLHVAQNYLNRLNLEIVSHPVNQGLGKSIKTGIFTILPNLVDEDIIVTLDADDTHPPELIPLMVEKISNFPPLIKGEKGDLNVRGNENRPYDLVIASRFCPGGKEFGLPWYRRVLSHTAMYVLNFFAPYPGLKDYTCGFRAFSGNLLQHAFRKYGDKLVTELGFAVTPELLLKLLTLNPAVCEVPFELHYERKQGKSKLRILHTVSRYLPLIYKFKLNKF